MPMAFAYRKRVPTASVIEESGGDGAPDNEGPDERFVRSNNGNVLEVMAGSPDAVLIPHNAVMRAVSCRLAHGF